MVLGPVQLPSEVASDVVIDVAGLSQNILKNALLEIKQYCHRYRECVEVWFVCERYNDVRIAATIFI